MRDGAKLIAVLGLAAVLAVFAGCSAKYQYGDAGDTPMYSTGFGPGELQQIADRMTASLLTFPPIVQVTEQRRPVVVVERVKNKTTQHIDTESITDSIRTRLIRSGKFRFLDKSRDGQTIDEIRRQQELGLTRQDQAAQFGTQEAAEYMLTASLSEIEQRKAEVWQRRKMVYYKFTMNLMNIRTGILEWADEKEIVKLKDSPRIGP